MLRQFAVATCLVLSTGCVHGSKSGENEFVPVLLNDCKSDMFWEAAIPADLAVENFTPPDTPYTGPFLLKAGNFTNVSPAHLEKAFHFVWSLDRLDPDPKVVEIPVKWVAMGHPRFRLEADCVTLTELYEGEPNDLDGRKPGGQ